jgi:hypothetical protein
LTHRREEVPEESGTNSNFVFDISPLAETSDFSGIYDLFIEYKTRSNIEEEMPAPTDDVQKDYECVVNIFGKDKLSQPRKLCKIEELYHLHVFDHSKKWRTWKKKPQFLRASNTFIIYSFFVFENIYYFYILDWVKVDSNGDGGHEALEMGDNITRWLQTAETYRLSIVKSS